MTRVISLMLGALLWVGALAASAQTTITQTTLSSAMTNSQTVAVVASATNAAVGGWLYIDHEAMQITAVSGTRLSVLRGTKTKVSSHASAANVFVFSVAQAAANLLPTEAAQRFGNCTPSDYQFLPFVDVNTGDVLFCEYEAANDAWRRWRKINIQGLNGAGSYRTAWTWP